MGDVLQEVRTLAEDGVNEIMLLGQNVNAYGKERGESFAGLLRAVNEIPDLLRIRFMTSHPKDVSDGLIAAMRECDKVCKAIHLPLQSGSSKILKDMNRNYTKESYLDLIRRIKEAVPGVAVSTDIMVGYPGETEADFSETLDVVKQAGFSGAFTFIYSPRTGTKAFDRKDTVPDEINAERFKRLNELINPILLKRNEGLIGRKLDILIDGKKSGVKGTQKGRADDNTLVHVIGSDAAPGEVVKAKITEAKTFYVVGILQ
jgi:tRNA-2-methylthio-N6-dimethylallyladenosine synthase